MALTLTAETREAGFCRATFASIAGALSTTATYQGLTMALRPDDPRPDANAVLNAKAHELDELDDALRWRTR